MISPSTFFVPATKPGAAGAGFPSERFAGLGGGHSDFDECLAGALHKPGSKEDDDDEKRSRSAHSHHARSAKHPDSVRQAESLNPGAVPPKLAPIVESPETLVSGWHSASPLDNAASASDDTGGESAETTGPASVLDPATLPGGLRPFAKEAASATVIPPTQRTLTALAGESTQPPPGLRPSANESADDASNFVGQQDTANGPTVNDAAKIAGLLLTGPGQTAVAAGSSSLQFVDFKQLMSGDEFDGTPIASGNAAVNATSPSLAKFADTGSLLKRAAAVSSVAELPEHSAAGKQVGIPVVAAIAGGEPMVSFPTPGAKEATATNASAAIEHFTRIETLLQNVLHVGDAMRPNGPGEMEMRLQLHGGAEDVTVRWQVAGDRLQVTFHTKSDGLRQALESGWKQLSTENTTFPAVALAEPQFSPSLPGGFAPDQQTGGGFSSSQQHPWSRDADADAAPVATWKTTPPTASTADSPASPERANGWCGWA